MNTVYKIALTLCAMTTHYCISTEDTSQKLSPLQSMTSGIVTGIGEVTCNQPLVYIKNIVQQNSGKPFTDIIRATVRDKEGAFKPLTCYRGYPINAGSMAIITPVQMVSNTLLADKVGNETPLQKIACAYGAGAIAALVATPTEYVMLHQQLMGKNAAKTIHELVTTRGIKTMLTGVVPTALRDGGFTVGYLALGNVVEQLLHIDNPLAGNVIAGVIAAIATHPCDTVKTRMQAQHTSLYSVIKKLYHNEGIKGFYSGLTPRGTRVILAILLMNTLSEKCKDIILGQHTIKE